MTLLLVTALLLQDPSAEATFKKILETAKGAKSCVVEVKSHRSPKISLKSDTYDAQSIMFLQDVDKAPWAFPRTRSEHPVTLVSDGTRLKCDSPDETFTSASPKTL